MKTVTALLLALLLTGCAHRKPNLTPQFTNEVVFTQSVVFVGPVTTANKLAWDAVPNIDVNGAALLTMKFYAGPSGQPLVFVSTLTNITCTADPVQITALGGTPGTPYVCSTPFTAAMVTAVNQLTATNNRTQGAVTVTIGTDEGPQSVPFTAKIIPGSPNNVHPK